MADPAPAAFASAVIEIRKAVFAAAVRHGEIAALSGLASICLECLVLAYGEAEAQAILAGLAADAPVMAGRWRLAEERPAGTA